MVAFCLLLVWIFFVFSVLLLFSLFPDIIPLVWNLVPHPWTQWAISGQKVSLTMELGIKCNTTGWSWIQQRPEQTSQARVVLPVHDLTAGEALVFPSITVQKALLRKVRSLRRTMDCVCRRRSRILIRGSTHGDKVFLYPWGSAQFWFSCWKLKLDFWKIVLGWGLVRWTGTPHSEI